MLKIQILHNDEVIEGKPSDMGQKRLTVWADLTDPDDGEWSFIASHVGVREEELKKLVDPKQRPILQDVGKFTAVVFNTPMVEKNAVVTKPALFLVSKEQKDFISIHSSSFVALNKINTYPILRKVELFEKGSTALLFAVLNEVMDMAYEAMDYISDEVDKLEQLVFQPQISSQVMKRMFNIKKGLIFFQRALSSDREVISAIEKDYGQFLDAKQLSSFRLLYSDITQLIELSTTYRDIIISAVEVHLSAISNNLNLVMKRLTAWAAIILVPSLIAGIYGMNFHFIPLAGHPAGFWYLISAMATLVVLLYLYFKYHDWI